MQTWKVKTLPGSLLAMSISWKVPGSIFLISSFTAEPDREQAIYVN